MPAGRTHEKINWLFLHIAIFGTLLVGFYCNFGFVGVVNVLLLIGGYLFGTYYFGPDLDINSKPFHRWGKLRFLWQPYQRLFHHRSFWTHGLIISDIIRMGYVLLWLMMPYALVYVVANPAWQQMHAFLTGVEQSHRAAYHCFLLGIVMASTVHIIADKYYVHFKKNTHKRKPKKRSR